MKTTLTLIATAATFAFATTAHADLIDFTDDTAYGSSISIDSTTTMSGTQSGGWNGTANGGNLNISEAGPGATGVLAGDNDGLGINDDEITFSAESFTMSFNHTVNITGLYFLDHFMPEVVHVSVNGGAPIDFSSLVTYDVTYKDDNLNNVGYSAHAVDLIGHTFTFIPGEPNEVADPDFALAAIDASPIPLPAGVLLLGGALAGLGLARRRA